MKLKITFAICTIILLHGALAEARLRATIEMRFADNEVKTYRFFSDQNQEGQTLPSGNKKYACSVAFDEKIGFVDVYCGVLGTDTIFASRTLCGPRDPATMLLVSTGAKDGKSYEATSIVAACEKLK